mmetsp:Transcript_105666/g.303699  ORF Transcript_105666/g.303699 Transcript_105666/m.303699 type:complete len:101 (+) Transcript_105666:63-365(+)
MRDARQPNGMQPSGCDLIAAISVLLPEASFELYCEWNVECRPVMNNKMCMSDRSESIGVSLGRGDGVPCHACLASIAPAPSQLDWRPSSAHPPAPSSARK